MDSNSNSCEMTWAKIEIDSENESIKRERLQWNSENTMKLIEAFERDCKELWDYKHPLNKDRCARQAKHDLLANMFGTSSEEISRKLHNLRTQFNNELRKIKRKSAGGEGSGMGGSGWEYFDALSFLMREPPVDPLETVDGVNLALAEFQADEEAEFAAVRARTKSPPRARKPVLRVAASAPPPLPPSAHPMMWPEEPQPRLRPGINADESQVGLRARIITPSRAHKPVLRVAASAPPPLPPSPHPMMWSEEPQQRLRPGINADESQIFGDFVASELRMLRSDESRKRLKRIIQKAILQIGEEEDVNIISG